MNAVEQQDWRYHGWTNKNTWTVVLWLCNEEPWYRRMQALKDSPDGPASLEKLVQAIIAEGDAKGTTPWRGFLHDLASLVFYYVPLDLYKTIGSIIGLFLGGDRTYNAVVIAMAQQALQQVNWTEIFEAIE